MSDQIKLARARKVAKPATKIEILLKLIKRPKGATLAELQKATGWQVHSVCGAISGILRKKLRLVVPFEASLKRGRVYCISQSANCGAGE